MIEKADLPRKLIESTITSLIKENPIGGKFKDGWDQMSNSLQFQIQAVQKHLDYLTMLKIFIDLKTHIDLDESFSSNIFMIK